MAYLQYLTIANTYTILLSDILLLCGQLLLWPKILQRSAFAVLEPGSQCDIATRRSTDDDLVAHNSETCMCK